MNNERATALTNQIRDALSVKHLNRPTPSAIDRIIQDAVELRSFVFGNRDVELAITYLKLMNLRNEDKQSFGIQAKYAIIGALAGYDPRRAAAALAA